MPRTEPPATSGRPRKARERVLESAYELFSREGVRAVGVDAVVTHAGVARMSLYRNFASKDDLVLAFLGQREERWTRGWLQTEVEQRAEAPAERLLAVFTIFDEWFQRPDFEGCSFINVLLETPDPESPVHQATVEQLARIRGFLTGLATAAEIEEPEAFAAQWHILMKGSIIAAGEGDRQAALRARDLGELLLRTRLDAASA
jgi:AcrR family transcriptional regulator